METLFPHTSCHHIPPIPLSPLPSCTSPVKNKYRKGKVVLGLGWGPNSFSPNYSSLSREASLGCTCNWKITRSGARKHWFDSRPLRGAILAWLFTLPRLECPTRWMVLRHQRSNGCKTASLYWNAPSEGAVVALRTAPAGRAVPRPASARRPPALRLPRARSC